MRALGILYRGWAFVRTFGVALRLVGGVVMIGGVAWISRLWNWMWLQDPLVIVVAIGFGFLIALAIVLAILGFVFTNYGNPSVPYPQIIDHIANKSITGSGHRWRHRKSIARFIQDAGFAFDQLKWHGQRGLIHMRGMRAESSIPQPILPEHWGAQGIGYGFPEPDPSGPWRITASGYGMAWSRPTMSEAEMFYRWPPVPLIGVYRKVVKWLKRKR